MSTLPSSAFPLFSQSRCQVSRCLEVHPKWTTRGRDGEREAGETGTDMLAGSAVERALVRNLEVEAAGDLLGVGEDLVHIVVGNHRNDAIGPEGEWRVSDGEPPITRSALAIMIHG